MMNSKQRVYASIRRQSLDRIPYYIWFHPDILDRFGETYATSGFATEAAIGNDVLQTWVSINGSMARPAAEGESFVDDFGITWLRQGYYNMVTRHPLASADRDGIRTHAFPDAARPERYSDIDLLVSRYGHDHFIGADVSGSIFEPAYHLRGMERVLVELTMQTAEAEALLDRTMHFTIDVALECLKRGVDWIWLGDDVGTQGGMMMSPTTWRAVLKPRLRDIIDRIRDAAPEMLIAYHSCGSIRPIIGDLVEIGVDVLNPLQPKARDMDNAAIKREFGAELSFMCGLDTQEFLQSASPSQVREETLRILEVMGQGGGFIFAGSHTIQPDVPMENIETMLATLRA